MKKCFVIENEYEDGPLCFDLDDPETPQTLVDYIKHNIDEDQFRVFKVTNLTIEQFNELE